MKVSQDLFNRIKGCVLDVHGREINDPSRVFVDLTPRPLTMKEQIQRLLRVELSAQAAAQGEETFEEADDFDVQDDFESEMVSPYEVMPEEVIVGRDTSVKASVKIPVPESGAVAGAKGAKKESAPGAKRGRAGQKAAAKSELVDDGGLSEIDLDGDEE